MQQQQSLPLGFVRGEPVLEKPENLYIPPDALELLLDAFSGPMDLLLYLIRREKLDILDLPILAIIRQYMAYVEMMRELKLELAADYLVMAAMLAEIKSRLLLPRPPSDETDEDDPRAELVRRLQEYEIVRQGAYELDQQPQQERDFFVANALAQVQASQAAPVEVGLDELVVALRAVMQQIDVSQHHQVSREVLSTRERMSQILDRLQQTPKLEFTQLFVQQEGRAGAVVSFLAILELNKEGMLRLIQAENFSTIYVHVGYVHEGAATSDGETHEAIADE
ncbi:segregation and condensation protein A [Aliidiomarina maris]|uniref:Segregation and condensation protein A n=1 Tax=Aliidiomarina maris TaxID=531312 RepID=A0A327X7Y0_9GAMM|nr:ScpA family protein [Aliidiomarina maris]RAK01762.1 condensin subunit ScpA [Aliidiomarina maris]RUO28577.1 segregation/condensation protein A [Aliidiomarina maris]